MKVRTLGGVCLTLSLAFAAPAVAQDFPSDADLRAMIQERVDGNVAVGIVLGVLEADGSVRVVTAGSGGEDARPLGPRSVFEIGSISKAFTGVLLAEAVRRGEVALDDPVQSLLPSGVTIPARGGSQVTLEDLATHHSALPRLPGNMAPADVQNPYADYTVSMMYDFLSGYTLPRDIGAQYEYSNLAVGLLGHALALRAGTEYEGLVGSRIVEPLGMEMTGIALSPGMREWMTVGHNVASEPVPLWDIPTLAGAGALRSNAEDMLRFLAANVGDPTSDLERAMRDSHEVRKELPGGQGGVALNWHVRFVGDERIVWHNGGTGGFRTFAGFDPERGVAVVVLTNSGHGADDIGFHLLAPELPLSPPTPPAAGREEVEVDVSILEEVVGEYQLTPQVIVSMTLEDGLLYTQLTGQPRFRVYAASESEFFLRVVEASLVVERDADGAVTGLVLHQGGQSIPAPRIR